MQNGSAPSSTSADDTLHVVAAVVERDGLILITRRLAGTHLEGLWEFPGGKVDALETHAAALRREMREELAGDVDVQDLILTTTHHYPARRVTLHFYRCALKGPIRPMLGQEIRWIARADLRSLAFPEADSALIELLSASA